MNNAFALFTVTGLELLDKDKSVIIHTRHLEVLATEMFKLYKNYCSQNNNLRHSSFFPYNVSKLSNTGLRVYPT